MHTPRTSVFILCFLIIMATESIAATPVFRKGASFGPEIETVVRAASLKDLDRDGDPDLVMAHEGSNSVWINNNLGAFSTTGQTIGTDSSFGVSLGDINLDTDVDAVFANHGISRVWDSWGGIIITQGTQETSWVDTKEGTTITFDDPGTGDYFELHQDLQDGTANACVLEDLNSDGYPDLVFANTGANTVWLNDGEGSFSDSQQRLGTSESTGVAMADLNGDGYMDVVFSNLGANTVYFNTGLGELLDSVQHLGSSDSLGLALGDIDGDGDADIVFANDGQDTVWLNNGLGAFLSSGQSLGNAQTRSVSLGDIDGDGDLDILAANGDPDGPSDHDYPDVLWLNDGQGNFTQSDLSFNSANSVCAFLMDLDNDGDQDVLAINTWPSENVVWIQVALPRVLTGTITENEDSTVSIWGILDSLGDHSVSDHGFVWNTTGDPDLTDEVLSLGKSTKTGIFNSLIADTDSGATYYIRAYAINDAGTSYGKTVMYDPSSSQESDCFIHTALKH